MPLAHSERRGLLSEVSWIYSNVRDAGETYRIRIRSRPYARGIRLRCPSPAWAASAPPPATPASQIADRSAARLSALSASGNWGGPALFLRQRNAAVRSPNVCRRQSVISVPSPRYIFRGIAARRCDRTAGAHPAPASGRDENAGHAKPGPIGRPFTIPSAAPGGGTCRRSVILVVMRMNTVFAHTSGLAAIASSLLATKAAPAAGMKSGCSDGVLWDDPRDRRQIVVGRVVLELPLPARAPCRAV